MLSMADADNFSRADVPKVASESAIQSRQTRRAACKEPRLTAAEAMQIRLLANVPELRDHRKIASVAAIGLALATAAA